ncbi:MAG: response regulator, partial [Bryobacteraceae bacterium]|nr:response regulator [Bryobacteraceae bacterium]
MRPISILLLEDNPLDVDLVLKHLQEWEMPFTAERVGTRDAFQEALTSRHYDVILSDFALPDFDGTDALEMARRLCPYTPFIFVSGMLGEEIAVESLKKGATDYVLKQRLHRLIPAIERALSERRIRAA